jgi:hypothetical protein
MEIANKSVCEKKLNENSEACKLKTELNKKMIQFL